MSTRLCPECGSFDVYPHCNLSTCEGLICLRAFCTYDSGDCTEPDGMSKPPPAERLDLVPGVVKQRFRRMLSIGTFTRTAWSQSPVANGWFMDPADLAPPWPVEELYDMWITFYHIQHLPVGGDK